MRTRAPGPGAQRGFGLIDIMIAGSIGVALIAAGSLQLAATQRDGDFGTAVEECRGIANYADVYWRTIATSSQNPATSVYSYTYNLNPPFQLAVTSFGTERGLPVNSLYGTAYAFGVAAGGQNAYCTFSIPAGIYNGTPVSGSPDVAIAANGSGGWDITVTASPNPDYGAHAFKLNQVRFTKEVFYGESPR